MADGAVGKLVFVIGSVVVKCHTQLPKVTQAKHRSTLLPGTGDRWKQNGDENGDDGDDHQ